MTHCIYCDPQHYVVYGECNYCGNCSRPRLIEFPNINREIQLKLLVGQLAKMQKEYNEKSKNSYGKEITLTEDVMYLEQDEFEKDPEVIAWEKELARLQTKIIVSIANHWKEPAKKIGEKC